MIRTNAYFAIAVIAAAAATQSNAAELQRATVEARQDTYAKPVLARKRAHGSKSFLWMEEAADRARRVKSGEIVVIPLVGHGTQTVPNGLIHDWIGAVFIPNATIESLVNVVHDYDRYKDIYKPVVMDSRSLESGGAEQEFSMVWQKHVLFLKAAMRGRYCAHEVVIDLDATTLQQVDGRGDPGGHLLPPDTGCGFIWRIYSIARYEQRGGGVYLEIEGIDFCRDIPHFMRWLVNPVVDHLSVSLVDNYSSADP